MCSSYPKPRSSLAGSSHASLIVKNCKSLGTWLATHSLTWQDVEFVMAAPLKSQVMEGDSGLPYATQTSSTVDPLFTVSLGVVTTTATLGVSVCTLKNLNHACNSHVLTNSTVTVGVRG